MVLFLAANQNCFAQASSDFNDNNNQGWVNGAAAQDPMVVNGGPAGPMDPYLRIVADGAGSGGKVVVFNSSNEWTGNYIDGNVVAIELSAANFSDQDLNIRLAFQGENGLPLVTNTSLDLAANDDIWQTFRFVIDTSNLVGTADFTQIMSDVGRVTIFHGGADNQRPNIVAQVGIDNVRQELGTSSVQTLGPEVFSLQPIAQPAKAGQAALQLVADQAGDFQADIFDLSGRSVSRLSGHTTSQLEQRIELFDLNPGNYIIRFALSGSFGQSIRTQRLIVH